MSAHFENHNLLPSIIANSLVQVPCAYNPSPHWCQPGLHSLVSEMKQIRSNQLGVKQALCQAEAASESLSQIKWANSRQLTAYETRFETLRKGCGTCTSMLKGGHPGCQPLFTKLWWQLSPRRNQPVEQSGCLIHLTAAVQWGDCWWQATRSRSPWCHASRVGEELGGRSSRVTQKFVICPSNLWE